MLNQLHEILHKALNALQTSSDSKTVEQWRITHLGRSSAMMQAFSQLGSLPQEERRQIGQKANEIRQALEGAYAEKLASIQKAELEKSIQSERLDVTLPGRSIARGKLHPSTQTLRQIYRILAEMGFQVYRSRDVEMDEYNFQLLNFPPHHPAREMQDTFYVKSPPDRANAEENPLVLRTHTSPGQIHAMREIAALNPSDPPPVRIILPGMCYRYEQITYRSEIQFNQVEGLAVGKHITFSDLKGTLSSFARRMFGQQVQTRFRASYFPFTEPSAEMDVQCFLCGGKGCPVCKHAGWLEILGCGMVHPIVLQNGGYDPQIYTGFAFGMGSERITLLRYQINDIRHFWANDLRFLEQF